MNPRAALLATALAVLTAGPLLAQSTGVRRQPPRKTPARQRDGASPSRGALDSAFVAGVATGASIRGAYGPVIYYTVWGGSTYGGAYGEIRGGYVEQAPPPGNIDVRGPPPGNAMAWIPGRWIWNGASYLWIEGRWTPIPGGYTTWVAGRWEHNQLGYYWVPGEWR